MPSLLRNFKLIFQKPTKGFSVYAEKPQTADKGTEHEKDKKHHYKEENRVTNFHPIFCISLCFFVRNEPRLTVLSTVIASVRPVCTLSQQSVSLMTRFVIKLRLFGVCRKAFFVGVPVKSANFMGRFIFERTDPRGKAQNSYRRGWREARRFARICPTPCLPSC